MAALAEDVQLKLAKLPLKLYSNSADSSFLNKQETGIQI